MKMRFIDQRNPKFIVRFHFHAISRDADDLDFPENPRIPKSIILREAAVPIISGTCVSILDVSISSSMAASIVVVSGILAGFFFQLSMQMLGRAASLTERDSRTGRSVYVLLLQDLSASSSYAALVSVACAGVAVAVGVSCAGWNERILAGLCIAIIVHLTLTFVLVLVRVFALTRSRVLASLDNGSPRDRALEN